MIFEREIGMSDTLLDALWLEGYSISFAVGVLKTILDQLGEERPVSYTHLDVYKRQVIYRHRRLSHLTKENIKFH